ncbi:Protein of unknown function [Bifidobacterium bohemicum]|uniref:DUF3073 domain-containing protein n=1 Tax=Bifidobacterium bohemicum DSM 22767 TaxID=1437606 RepID=A0A086ZH70_9BIFI|nr:DUF3073 domain-containing protein [Bifidobacterium bohemicum]KFI45870.1 hypothetical protein BBOH_0674 [Bifidobacterium bohemicum DSM 22767]SCC16037.1 Protein of unknown function [Bifidobacterium bohemicum]
MGRGRQKAKQQKIARKLKYLTTDTNYDELAKELSARDSGIGSPDSFGDVELEQGEEATSFAARTAASASVDDDLDDYAKWAAEAAAKATSAEGASAKSVRPKPHKPIHMPVPSVLHRPQSKKD